MCGISAIIDLRRGPIDLADLLSMHAGLSHRGPDGEGFLFVDAAMAPKKSADDSILGVAFRRLRILDLSDRADQPLAGQSGRKWIALNGEIYNFVELRAALRKDGYAFKTTGDAEVALAAYDRWGTAAFERFNGMWAILIVDLDRGVLVGSRDRLGIKPLFYAVDGDRLLLASEPKVIASIMRGGARIARRRFVDFLRGLPPRSASGTMFDGVEPVPAATWFSLDLRRPEPPRFTPFWNLASFVHEPDEAAAHRDLKSDLLAVLESSVEMHMVADVPVGLLLSGGLDSSIVARLMSTARHRRGEQPPIAISLAQDNPQLDESPFAKAVVDLGGLQWRRNGLSVEDGWAIADAVVAAQGEPLLGFDVLAHYRLFQLARENGLTVVLEGGGADEIFGGYPFYEAVHFADMIRKRQFGRAFSDLRATAGIRKRSIPKVIATYAIGAARNLREPTRPQWLRPESIDRRTPAGNNGLEFRWALNRLLFEQTRETNLPAILLHQDRNSMAHSIESRVPYLDHRVVEMAFGIPISWKVGEGQRKRLLREAARPLLPPVVADRADKRGVIFTPRWLDLRSHGAGIEEVIGSARLRDCPYLDGAAVRKFVRSYMDGSHDDAHGVWRLYTAGLWLDRFSPSAA